MGSLIRSTNLWGYPELVRELGGDPTALMARFHLTPGVEHQEDAFIPFEATALLLDASAEALDCPDFGLRLVRWQGLDILGPVAVIARNSQTVADGMGAVARFLYVHSPALELTPAAPLRPGTLRFTYRVKELALPRLRQAYELSMANGVQIIRLLGGPGSDPVVVSLLHSRLGPEASYVEALGPSVAFDQDWCGFEVAADLAAKPIDTADPATRDIATKYLEAAFLPSGTPVAERVADLARRLLPTAHCTIEVVADQLAMHPRTLQRRLSEEGVQFHDVIDTERRNLAARYLADPRFGLGQVAGLLGYAEQSSLNRSCRRWFGSTPRAYRRSQLP